MKRVMKVNSRKSNSRKSNSRKLTNYLKLANLVVQITLLLWLVASWITVALYNTSPEAYTKITSWNMLKVMAKYFG